jgi:hypothetical protein
MTYDEARECARALLEDPVSPGPERLPSAIRDFERAYPSITAEVRSFSSVQTQSVRHNLDFQTALLRIASIECAAGASEARCREWFRCLASLAAWVPTGAATPLRPESAAIWAALACDFDDPAIATWPDEPGVEATPERVVYRLTTRKAVQPTAPRNRFDNALWEDLCAAVEARRESAVSAALQSIADWWWSENRGAGVPDFDPDRFSTFEPTPNAALALALARDRMEIELDAPERERFYYVGLMLADRRDRE